MSRLLIHSLFNVGILELSPFAYISNFWDHAENESTLKQKRYCLRQHNVMHRESALERRGVLLYIESDIDVDYVKELLRFVSPL